MKKNVAGALIWVGVTSLLVALLMAFISALVAAVIFDAPGDNAPGDSGRLTLEQYLQVFFTLGPIGIVVNALRLRGMKEEQMIDEALGVIGAVTASVFLAAVGLLITFYPCLPVGLMAAYLAGLFVTFTRS